MYLTATTRRGFTMIELVLVVAVMLVLAIVVLTPFRNFGERELLNVGVRETRSLLDQAREATLSSRNDTVYGVHFATSTLTLFAGNNYVLGDASNTVITLDSRISVLATNLAGGGANVVFKRLTGETDNYGTITLAAADNASSTRTISVERTGVVEEE